MIAGTTALYERLMRKRIPISGKKPRPRRPIGSAVKPPGTGPG
jgi:hypothetical protein